MRDHQEAGECLGSPGPDKLLGFDFTSSKAMMNCSNGTCLFCGLSGGAMGGGGSFHACLRYLRYLLAGSCASVKTR